MLVLANRKAFHTACRWVGGLFEICAAFLILSSTTPADAAAYRTQTNVVAEISFEATRDHADPFNTIEVDAVFTDPAGRQFRTPAFWAGGKVWKVRYASPVAGTHRFRTECRGSGDQGLHGVVGEVQIERYAGNNPLYVHGPLHVSTSRRYLEHHDGKPFFWLGDTWWMGLCHRLRWPEDFKTLAADRKQKGFTVIQIVAGLYPDMPAFDPRGANEAGFPWEPNYASIRPAYFDAADVRLRHLVDEGFTPCVVGAWGYFLPWTGEEKMRRHWRYLIARWGAMPVVWCVAGEANLPWYLAKGFPYDDRQQVRGWTEVARYIRDTDPFRRPLTIHPTAIGRYTSRHAIDDAGLLDFDMLQTPHGQREAVPITVKAVRESYAAAPTMPVIDGEASYEMLSDSLPTRWTRTMFWLCMTGGTAGHTYGANGIWQCNRKDQPHGASPHGGNYGKISWDEAMRLPGSTQIALGKRLLEQYPWHEFRPHPEWATTATQALPDMTGVHWIWYPEGSPAKDAPVAKRCFRKSFTLPQDAAIKQASVWVTADDAYQVRINGQAVGAGGNWHELARFGGLQRILKPGSNVLAIVGENSAANVPANPAGMIARLEVELEGGKKIILSTDATWRAAKTEIAGWDASGLDDSSWPSAAMAARYGDSPWGRFEPSSKELAGAQAVGIAGGVRLIYSPQNEAVTVHHLGPKATYTATYFDTIQGNKTLIGEIVSDSKGDWTCPPPPAAAEDWVLILEPKTPKPADGGTSGSPGMPSGQRIAIANPDIAWRLDWSDGVLKSVALDNFRSGRRGALSDVHEIALAFSASVDRLQEPLVRVTDFKVRSARLADPQHAILELKSAAAAVDVTVHYQLEGPTRRKWIEVHNRGGKDLLLLDVTLDDFACDGLAEGGGQGFPVFIEDDCFAAVEHPSGMNYAGRGRVKLEHHPGRRLAAGESFRSRVAIVSVSRRGEAREHFNQYLLSKSVRRPDPVSAYTPFGINNQWGGAPTLDDEQTLDVLGILDQWRRKGNRFDFFTLDTGWVEPNSNLARFRLACFPDGPGRIVDRVHALGMKFGLWFATSWAAESCWDYPPALAGQAVPSLTYRLGYPDKAREGHMFCLGTAAYYQTLHDAVLHHVRENRARLLKFDGGSYYCDNPAHGHLPGKYSTELMHDRLIELAAHARAAAPDVFVIWYWGARSPFWALHGDMIFESGLHMEGSATSAFPSLYYRDSVTVAQDQNAQHARLIPPRLKDSLGVWLADTRWGNFMGKERWREAMVMDLGRGSKLFPNLWGNLYLLDDKDVEFLARLSSIARDDASLFQNRRPIGGEAARNEVYGYAHCRGERGYLFLNNMHFAARRADLSLNGSLGLEAKPGAPLEIVSEFPEPSRLVKLDGTAYRSGEPLQVWLRPFETLMLQVKPASEAAVSCPVRTVTEESARALGVRLPLVKAPSDPRLDVRFTDAARFAQANLVKKTYTLKTVLPSLEGPQPILAVVVRLRQGAQEWRYSPVVCDIVQARARVGETNVQFNPVPDGRQFGNTQKAGCSWVVYKVRLGRSWSQAPLTLAVHANLPDGVEAEIESWVVGRWWNDSARPASDGYYNDAPS